MDYDLLTYASVLDSPEAPLGGDHVSATEWTRLWPDPLSWLYRKN